MIKRQCYGTNSMHYTYGPIFYRPEVRQEENGELNDIRSNTEGKLDPNIDIPC